MNDTQKGRIHYAGIINNDVVNGQGVCVSYWTQGCPFRCKDCHNPETWEYEGGLIGEPTQLIRTIVEAISKNGIQRNLSILGGEPLCLPNREFVARLLREIKAIYPAIVTYVWTGYSFGSVKQILPQEDLANIDFLIDGQYDLDRRDITLTLRGSSNQRIIDVKSSLETENEIDISNRYDDGEY